MICIRLICCIQAHTKFSGKILPKKRKFLKRILTYMYFSLYNEINMRHLDVQKHASCKNGQNIRIRIVQKISNTLWPILGNDWE